MTCKARKHVSVRKRHAVKICCKEMTCLYDIDVQMLHDCMLTVNYVCIIMLCLNNHDIVSRIVSAKEDDRNDARAKKIVNQMMFAEGL